MIPKRYNTTNICEKIKENGKICGEPLGYRNALQERDKEGNPTGRWICKRHYNKDYNKRSGCGNNLFREMRDSRTGNLDPDSTKAKGDIFEAVTCRARGVKNLNIENDNFHSKIDHSIDLEYGIIQSIWYNTINMV